MEKIPCVYILASKKNGTLYTGVTSNLPGRVYQHKSHSVEGFSSKYKLTVLVWYECCDDMYSAISREKQIKAGSRKNKIKF